MSNGNMKKLYLIGPCSVGCHSTEYVAGGALKDALRSGCGAGQCGPRTCFLWSWPSSDTGPHIFSRYLELRWERCGQNGPRRQNAIFNLLRRAWGLVIITPDIEVKKHGLESPLFFWKVTGP